MTTQTPTQAPGLQPGDPVIVTALRVQPSCFYHGPQTTDVYHGIYLGIPRFEHSIAQVRVGSQVRRFPLEYLRPVTS